jgi:MerR family transcriptional regulator/heat shock protein HspR
MSRHNHAVYVISVAAELAGMHPQTLRIYERRGLLTPARTTGGNRRYSEADIARLLRITELASTGMNLEGIRHAMALEDEVVRLRGEVEQLRQGLMHAINEIESRGRGNLVPLRQTIARFGERPSIFDPDR